MRYKLIEKGFCSYSVQVFDGDLLVSDCDMMKDVNGWRILNMNVQGYSTNSPQHKTPEAAAEWYTDILELCR